MSGSARICLGIGYRTDDAEVALAAALVLVGLGEEAYDELLGHHLMNGFATPKRPDRGLDWLGRRVRGARRGGEPAGRATAPRRTPRCSQQAVAELTGGSAAPVLQDAAAPAGEPGLRSSDGARRRRPRTEARFHPCGGAGPLLEAPPVRSWRNW